MRWNIRDRVTGEVRLMDTPARKNHAAFIEGLRQTTTVGQGWGRASEGPQGSNRWGR